MSLVCVQRPHCFCRFGGQFSKPSRRCKRRVAHGCMHKEKTLLRRLPRRMRKRSCMFVNRMASLLSALRSATRATAALAQVRYTYSSAIAPILTVSCRRAPVLAVAARPDACGLSSVVTLTPTARRSMSSRCFSSDARPALTSLSEDELMMRDSVSKFSRYRACCPALRFQC